MNIEKLMKKWKPVLDSEVLNKSTNSQDDVLAVFLEQQYIYKKTICLNDFAEPYSKYLLPIVGRVLSRLISSGISICMKDMKYETIPESDQVPVTKDNWYLHPINVEIEYGKLDHNYNKQIINDLRECFNSEVGLLITEGFEYEIEQYYLGLVKDGKLILPIAPLVKIVDFDLANTKGDNSHIDVDVLVPLTTLQ